MIRLHDALSSRRERLRAQHPESGSALLMSVLFIVFAGGVMLVLLSVLLSQLQSIQIAQKNTRTGYSAQAGIQSALSVLRSNAKTVVVGSTPTPYGDPTKLPASLTGSVDGDDGSTLRYSVTIQYFTVDPTGKSDAWLQANALPHPLTGDPAKQPKFARLVAEGSDSAVSGLTDPIGDRTVTALYTFTTTNVNIPGGLIRGTDGTSCLKADRALAGSLIQMVPAGSCNDDTLDMWVYDTDYRLKLASTMGTSNVLCITGQRWVSTATGTDSSVVNATLQPCVGSNSAAYGNQLWSWEPPGSWVGQNKGNSGRTNRWLELNGTVLIERTSSTGPFRPTPSVGAGAASYLTKQIVNYSEFGRCMDVTDNQIGKSFMIVYPCKQDPGGTGANLNWNHKWYYNEPTGTSTSTGAQQITVNPTPSTKQCLTTRAPSAGNTDVHFTGCSSANEQKFVRNADTGNPLTSYTFQLAGDRSKCLAAVPEPGYAWSHIRMVACNGSTTQKWNAPPMTSGSSLGGYKELG